MPSKKYWLQALYLYLMYVGIAVLTNALYTINNIPPLEYLIFFGGITVSLGMIAKLLEYLHSL